MPQLRQLRLLVAIMVCRKCKRKVLFGTHIEEETSEEEEEEPEPAYNLLFMRGESPLSIVR